MKILLRLMLPCLLIATLGVQAQNEQQMFWQLNGIPAPNQGIIYDFEADIVGQAPANITRTTGSPTAPTPVVVTAGSGKALSFTSQNAIVAYDLTNFSSASDQTLTWKETYTTSASGGFTLRANGSGPTYPTSPGVDYSYVKKGYLFQVRPSANLLIVSYNQPGGIFETLLSATLNASGANTPRWYRASAIGETLKFEYSDDGVNFTTVITVTDTRATSGGIQYSTGYYNLTANGTQIDDVSYTADIADQINISSVKNFQFFQRDSQNQANIPISGTYVGTPTSIEVSFNGGAFVTIDAAPSNGTFSGTLNNQAVGQGDLIVRFSNDNTISKTFTNVSVGDIFVIAGQSNASARGITLNSYSHPTLKAGLFGNDDVWKELVDPHDSGTGQIDAISSDGNDAGGSPWPIIVTHIMGTYNVPVAFLPAAKGGSYSSQWQPPTTRNDASTLFGSMTRRIDAIGGKIAGVLWYQGESDALQDSNISQTTYENNLNTIVNTLASYYPGVEVMVGHIGQLRLIPPGGLFTGIDIIRKAQINVINTNANVLMGPANYDINLADEGGDSVHFKSDTDMAKFAARWSAAVDKHFYSGTNGYGPIKSAISYDAANNKVIVTFTDDNATAINLASTVAASSFKLKNNGADVAISSVAINGLNVEITPTTALNTTQSMTLTYASLNDAVSQAIYDDANLPAQPFYDETITPQ